MLKFVTPRTQQFPVLTQAALAYPPLQPLIKVLFRSIAHPELAKLSVHNLYFDFISRSVIIVLLGMVLRRILDDGKSAGSHCPCGPKAVQKVRCRPLASN